MDIEKLKQSLRIDEGFRGELYKDTRNKWTFGYGHCIEDKPISKAAAEFILDEDVKDIVSDINRNLPWVQYLTANRQMAIARMVFQMGINGVLGFKKMLKALEAGDYSKAYDEALSSDWAKQTPNRAKQTSLLIKNG